MKGKRARFGTLVARYYSIVYSFASRLTDDPREAVLLTHEAFTTTRKKLRNHRNEVELVTTLLDAVIGRGFLGARIEPQVTAV
jgi:DNA-directed RNA polymerase specialized sigma24 family protein